MQTLTRQSRAALAMAALAIFVFSSAAAQTVLQPKIAPELEEFDFLLGEWATRVEFFDSQGSVRRTQTFSAIVEPILEGVVYKSRTGPQDKSIHFGETWYLFDAATRTHHIVTADLQGNFDVFRGLIRNDKKIFTSGAKPWSDGKHIIWRRTYYAITKDSHEVLMEYSFDDGHSWTRANHWTRTRP